MFDRGLIAVADDAAILVARGRIADETARRLIRSEGRLIPPERLGEHPHPACLKWHRDRRFKG